MPELPEVETTVRGLNKKVLNRTFIDVWSDWEKLVKKPKDFKTFQKEIKDKKIIKIWRRAKNIIFDLSEGYSLLVHQKMTGHLMVGEWKQINNKWQSVGKGFLEEKINTFLHIIFFLDNPPSHPLLHKATDGQSKATDGQGKKMIALSDVRKFAKVELWKTEELLNSKEFKNLGPEPLDKNFTFQKFKESIKGKKSLPVGRQGKVKQVIMNPEIIAGIGNIYSSEALWRAKIHPQKSVAKLSDLELKLLYQAIKKVLGLAVKLGGESFSDYRKVDGSKGNFDAERKAYKREGQKCHRCGTLIKRLKFGGRSAFFCPHCQTL